MQHDDGSLAGPDDGAAEVEGLDQLLLDAFGEGEEQAESEHDADLRLPERYEHVAEVGRGGVGVVFVAEDRTLSRRVAVKVLQQRHHGSPLLRAKFEAEGRLAAQLDHPGILGVLDVGQTGDARPFFTMRLVPGENLASRLAARTPDDPHVGTWLPVFVRVCEAMAYAHARGVVHRDLKPANILLGEFGEVLVGDWGMAKVVAETSAGPQGGGAAAPLVVAVEGLVSQTGSLWGTPAYMAPEQACGASDAASPRADVFGLGAILCEILTGAPPYTGSPQEVLEQARRGEIGGAELRLGRCGAHDELVALTRRCLSVDPGERPAGALEIARVVQRHLVTLQERAQAAALTAAAAEARASAERRSRQAQRAWFACVLVLLFAVAGGFLVWQEQATARSGRDTTAVEQALGEAFERWREAGPRGDPADWRVAVTAGAAAARLAETGEVPPSLRLRAQTFAAEAAVEFEQASRRAAERAADEQLRARLAELDGRHWFDDDLRGKDNAYAALFAGIGVDPHDGEPGPMAERIRGQRLREDLSIALDRWWGTAMALEPQAPRTQAIAALARLVDDDPLRQRLRALKSSPDAGEARSLAASVDLRALPPYTIFLLFDAAAAAGERAVAQDLLERAQLEHPADFGLASLLAQECGGRGDHQGEARFASVALALRPGAMHPGNRLATWLDATGRAGQAELLFTRLAETHPHEPGLWHNVGAVHLLHGRFDEAEAALRRAEQAGAASAVTANLLARALRKQRRFDEARTWFATAASRDPALADPWVSLGAMLCDDLGDPAGAVAAFDRALQIAPGATDAMGNRAIALQKLGRNDEARAQWRTLADTDARLAQPRQMLAIAAYREQDPRAAVALAFEAAQAKPDLADAWYLLGTSLEDLDEPNAALACLRACLRVDPKHASAWHDLGWMLVDGDDTRAEAIEAYRRSIALRPDVAMSHYNLAYAQYRAGDFAACRQALAEALRLAPDLAIAKELLESLPRQ